MQKAHWHALQSVLRGSAVLFPSKKHADVTRAFASGFRGRKDGREDPLAAGRLEDRSRAGGGGGRDGGHGRGKGGGRKGRKEGEWEGTGRAGKKGRGGGGRK